MRALLTMLLVAGCPIPGDEDDNKKSATKAPVPPKTDREDDGKDDIDPPPPVLQPSGLTKAQESDFFHRPEGSAIIPTSFLLALEVADDKTGKLMFADNLERYGLIQNPHETKRLPIGFAEEEVETSLFGNWVGINCAACHVSQILVDGRPRLLVGAPAQFDAGRFFDDLGAALKATTKDFKKGFRFLKRLASPEEQAMLAKFADSSKAYALLQSKPGTSKVQDFETLDAEAIEKFCELVGSNKLLLAELDGTSDLQAKSSRGYLAKVCESLGLLRARIEQIERALDPDVVGGVDGGPGRIDAFGGARNALFGPPFRELDAPIAFPHLWGIGDLDWFHWDGNTDSILERNVGQAIGLGALVNKTTHESSLRIGNILDLEGLARKLQAPKWPFAMPPENAITRGRGLFGEHCEKCHAQDKPRYCTDPEKFDGLDPKRAMSFAVPLHGGREYAAAIAEEMRAIITKEQGNPPPASVWRTTKSYCARDLRSIWATAPYLHNNSVRTLRQLLEPPSGRDQSFFAGGIEYDANDLGFVDKQSGSPKFSTKELGNGNGGHEYGTGLQPDEKQALLDFLKTL